jgi:hypothetical protein
VPLGEAIAGFADEARRLRGRLAKLDEAGRPRGRD